MAILSSNKFGLNFAAVDGVNYVNVTDLINVMQMTTREAVRLHGAGQLSEDNVTGVINSLGAVASAVTGIVHPDVQVLLDAVDVLMGVDITSEND